MRTRGNSGGSGKSFSVVLNSFPTNGKVVCGFHPTKITLSCTQYSGNYPMFNFYDVDIYGANQYRSVGYSSGGKFDAMRNIGSGAGFESIDDDGFTIMLALGQYYGGDIMVTAAE